MYNLVIEKNVPHDCQEIFQKYHTYFSLYTETCKQFNKMKESNKVLIDRLEKATRSYQSCVSDKATLQDDLDSCARSRDEIEKLFFLVTLNRNNAILPPPSSPLFNQELAQKRKLEKLQRIYNKQELEFQKYEEEMGRDEKPEEENECTKDAVILKLQDNVNILTKHIKDLDTQIELLNLKLQEKNNEIRDLQDTDLKQSLENKNQNTTILLNQVTIEELRDETESLRDRVDEYKIQNDRLEDENRELSMSLTSSNIQLSEHESSFEADRVSITKLERELEELRVANQNLNGDNTKLNADLQKSNKITKIIQTKNKNISEKLEKRESTIRNLEATINELNNAKIKLGEERFMVSQENEKLKTQIQSEGDCNQHLFDTINHLNERIVQHGHEYQQYKSSCEMTINNLNLKIENQNERFMSEKTKLLSESEALTAHVHEIKIEMGKFNGLETALRTLFVDCSIERSSSVDVLEGLKQVQNVFEGLHDTIDSLKSENEAQVINLRSTILVLEESKNDLLKDVNEKTLEMNELIVNFEKEKSLLTQKSAHDQLTIQYLNEDLQKQQNADEPMDTAISQLEAKNRDVNEENLLLKDRFSTLEDKYKRLVQKYSKLEKQSKHDFKEREIWKGKLASLNTQNDFLKRGKGKLLEDLKKLEGKLITEERAMYLSRKEYHQNIAVLQRQAQRHYDCKTLTSEEMAIDENDLKRYYDTIFKYFEEIFAMCLQNTLNHSPPDWHNQILQNFEPVKTFINQHKNRTIKFDLPQTFLENFQENQELSELKELRLYKEKFDTVMPHLSYLFGEGGVEGKSGVDDWFTLQSYLIKSRDIFQENGVRNFIDFMVIHNQSLSSLKACYMTQETLKLFFGEPYSQIELKVSSMIDVLEKFGGYQLVSRLDNISFYKDSFSHYKILFQIMCELPGKHQSVTDDTTQHYFSLLRLILEIHEDNPTENNTEQMKKHFMNKRLKDLFDLDLQQLKNIRQSKKRKLDYPLSTSP